MMKIVKAHKYRLYPTEEQKNKINQTIGCARFIYNKMLEDKINYYNKNKKSLNNTPAQYKEEYEFLKEVDSQALSQSHQDLNSAYRNFFRKNSKFPKFKKKGVNFAMSDFYVDSEGVKGNYPKFFRKSQEKLAKEQRKLSRMVKGSNNYNKQKIKVAKVYEKIANQRKDFLHKTSRKIANSYDVVCVEDLNMKAMSQTFKFGKSVHDNGWGMFVQMLRYKLEESGKYLITADKFFPSTKQCSACHNKKDEIHLSERTYECSSCGLEIDRDLNAALNLKQYAVKSLQVNRVSSDFVI